MLPRCHSLLALGLLLCCNVLEIKYSGINAQSSPSLTEVPSTQSFHPQNASVARPSTFSSHASTTVRGEMTSRKTEMNQVVEGSMTKMKQPSTTTKQEVRLTSTTVASTNGTVDESPANPVGEYRIIYFGVATIKNDEACHTKLIFNGIITRRQKYVEFS